MKSRMPRWLTATTGVLLLGWGAFGGCALPGTGGDLVEISWAIRGEVPAAPVVVETVGPEPWQVELTEATLLVGPVYAFAPPQFSARGIGALLRPGRALAHAGDDNTGGARVVAELLDQVPVDLLDPQQRLLGTTVAEAGPVDIANVVFDEARFERAGPDGPTRGGHALLRGVARRDEGAGERMVRFEAVLKHTVPDDRIARRVEALPVAGGELVEGARIEIAVDPRLWVRQMRFDALLGDAEGNVDQGDPDDVLFVDEPSQLHNAWYLGMRDPRGWEVRVVAPGAIQDEAGEGTSAASVETFPEEE